ncbi:helix-turn-helix domain-containing protein [Vagococcus sp. PNs007]|uniref:Helix-turn-helix domain-containing protein n=1 Tax=Vagococcus proximus TaxID=2991417 RepID=A0ABT5WZ22_9ENTE|nr:helix-turn-helix domain-containing protein [Vagococcus proximus]MDF0479005.1 helix-turn-helix domain-containing protein [Vagococcus proximus]
MSQLFFNNAQMEKYEVLHYILSLHQNEQVNQQFAKKLSVDRHRIRTINKDLVDCGVELKIKSNLGYCYSENIDREDMLEYYNKKILAKYYYYLLNQSNLFHLISYLVNNKRATIETAACDLSISNSYIYKLVSHFNEVSGPEYGVTIEIVKKHLAFTGDEDKLIVALFAFYAVAPECDYYNYSTIEPKSDQFLELLRAPLISILEKTEDCTDADLLFELYKSLYRTSPTSRSIESIGYDLIQEGGPLVKIVSKLIKYYSNQYGQINLKDLSFYVPELIKLMVLLKVKPTPLYCIEIDDVAMKDDDYQEITIVERILLEEKFYLERKKIKGLICFMKRFLNHSRNLVKVKIYVNLIDSFLLTDLYKKSISQLFNFDTVCLVEDIDVANIVLTNDMRQVKTYDKTKFVYVIQEVTEEFEKKDYLHFIIKIVKKLSSK